MEKKRIFDTANANVNECIRKMIVVDNNRKEEIESWYKQAYENARMEIQLMKIENVSQDELSVIAREILFGSTFEQIKNIVSDIYLNHDLRRSTYAAKGQLTIEQPLDVADAGSIYDEVSQNGNGGALQNGEEEKSGESKASDSEKGKIVVEADIKTVKTKKAVKRFLVDRIILGEDEGKIEIKWAELGSLDKKRLENGGKEKAEEIKRCLKKSSDKPQCEDQMQR